MAAALRRYYRGHNLVTRREVPTAQSRVYTKNNADPGSRVKPALAVLAVGGYAVIALLLMVAARRPKADAPLERAARSEIEYRVSLLLRNPESARFPSHRQELVRAGDGRYRGSGIVYSANEANATVPATYTCEVQFRDDEEIQVEFLQLGDLVVVR